MPILPRTLASFLCSAAAISQGNAGYADLSFQNPTAQGTATLTATVYYPAMAPGRDAPLLPRAGGHPVVVFLHGLNVLGRGYGALGQRFAEQGYVVVLGNTALSSATTQINDGIAMFPALVQANGQAGHLLQGALDMGRAAVSGHSMGGSSTCGVLAANPGYRAGFCFSPGVAPAAAQVHVPMGICHGTGDTFLDWQTFGVALYQGLVNVPVLKFFYVLGQDCTHGNVAGYTQNNQIDLDVFAASSQVALGFFDRFLLDDAAGLESVIGPTARAEARLFQLDTAIYSPQLWVVGNPRPGQTVTFTTAAAPGPAALFCALAEGNWPTPFGTALLDLTSLIEVSTGVAGIDHLWLSPLTIPNDAALVGLQLPFQGLATSELGAFQVTGMVRVQVLP
jgi:hypothetical protein